MHSVRLYLRKPAASSRTTLPLLTSVLPAAAAATAIRWSMLSEGGVTKDVLQIVLQEHINDML
jgi:hypothetical protein